MLVRLQLPATTTAMGTAAISALPVGLVVGGGLAGGVMLMLRKKTAPYQKSSGLENLAKTVSKIIFLSLLAKYKCLVEQGSAMESKAVEVWKSQDKGSKIS